MTNYLHVRLIVALFLGVFIGNLALAADAPLIKLMPGDTPPAALGKTREGDEIVTTQFAGKVLVVTFWASWCPPCRAELGVLERVQQLAGKERLHVVAVNIEDRDKFRAVSRALSTLSLTLTNDPSKRASQAFGVNGIPHMVIVGKDGRVINVHRGYAESALNGLVAEINAALAGAAEGSASAVKG